MTARKIIVYIATSTDGYIARLDGNVDWLHRPPIAGNYGMPAFCRSIDTILWGRKTYEFGVSRGGPIDTKAKNYVFTHDPSRLKRMPGVEFVTAPVATFAKQLRAGRGKDIWMMGGAALIASFLDAGEIDEFMIHVIPILVGEGISLIQPRHRSIPLVLKSTRRFSDGVVRLHYALTRKTKP